MAFASQQIHLYKRIKENLSHGFTLTNKHPYFNICAHSLSLVENLLFELRWALVGGLLEKVTHLKVRTY